jgi:hypothetical protein
VLLGSCDRIDEAKIVGAISLNDRNPESFAAMNPHHPMLQFWDHEELSLAFDENEPLCFYLSDLPGVVRDDLALDILTHFPES